MSTSMLLGRVVLPAAAFLLAAALAWHSVRSISGRPGRGTDRTAAVLTGGPPRAAADSSGGVTAEGRVAAYPGAEVTVGTEVLGTILSMPAQENAAVRKGDLLVELRADDVRASLHEAHSRRTEAEVGLRLEQMRSQLDRILPVLTNKGAPTAETRRETLTAALARRDAAQAAVDRLEAESAKYRILAPIDGVVIDRHADPGETVSPASPLVTIADLNRLRVEAEVDELDIPRVSPHARATITAEGYRGRRWRGEVEAIAHAVVGRQTRPAHPGRASDTRVLLVKIAFREPNPLKLGQRVEVEIESDSPDPDR
jgi:RND family efflux transporter MFP subunit